MSDISRTWTSGDKRSAVVSTFQQHLHSSDSDITAGTLCTFHPGALDFPEERPLMEELPPQQLSSSEHASSLDLRLSPGVQTGLNLLQPPGPFQLQHLFVY